MAWSRFDVEQKWMLGVAASVGVLAIVAGTAGIVMSGGGGSSTDADVATAPDAVDHSGAPDLTSVTETTRATTTTTSPLPEDRALVLLSTTTTSSPSSTSTSTTIDPFALPTLSEGDEGTEVIELQRMLNNVTGSRLVPDGVYGPATTDAVRNFQAFIGLPATGDADDATRTALVEIDAGRSTAVPTWPVPAIGNGGRDGCQVAVIGDSLMAGAEQLQADKLAEINCASAVDGVGGRSLNYGWQCRVFKPNGSTPLLLLPEPEAGNSTCAPSGLELLELWRDGGALGDIVVIALGTNDAGLYSPEQWTGHWNEALRLAGDRPVLFVTTKARAGSSWVSTEDTYSAALRLWCDTQPRCYLADWALTPAANDSSLYVDHVHLRRAGTDARSDFIRDSVAALFEGRPLPNPAPLPTVTTTTLPGTTTTVPKSTTPTTTVPKTTTTSSTTSTSTTTTTTSTSTTTTTTTTVAPATSSTSTSSP